MQLHLACPNGNPVVDFVELGQVTNMFGVPESTCCRGVPQTVLNLVQRAALDCCGMRRGTVPDLVRHGQRSAWNHGQPLIEGANKVWPAEAPKLLACSAPVPKLEQHLAGKTSAGQITVRVDETSRTSFSTK